MKSRYHRNKYSPAIIIPAHQTPMVGGGEEIPLWPGELLENSNLIYLFASISGGGGGVGKRRERAHNAEQVGREKWAPVKRSSSDIRFTYNGRRTAIRAAAAAAAAALLMLLMLPLLCWPTERTCATGIGIEGRNFSQELESLRPK